MEMPKIIFRKEPKQAPHSVNHCYIINKIYSPLHFKSLLIFAFSLGLRWILPSYFRSCQIEERGLDERMKVRRDYGTRAWRKISGKRGNNDTENFLDYFECNKGYHRSRCERDAEMRGWRKFAKKVGRVKKLFVTNIA